MVVFCCGSINVAHVIFMNFIPTPLPPSLTRSPSSGQRDVLVCRASHGGRDVLQPPEFPPVAAGDGMGVGGRVPGAGVQDVEQGRAALDLRHTSARRRGLVVPE